MKFFEKYNRKIAAVIVALLVLAMVATTVLPYLG